ALAQLAKLRVCRLGFTSQCSELRLDCKELLQLLPHSTRIIDLGQKIDARLVEAGKLLIGGADFGGALLVGRREASRVLFHGIELRRSTLRDLERTLEPSDSLFHRTELCRTLGHRFEAAELLRGLLGAGDEGRERGAVVLGMVGGCERRLLRFTGGLTLLEGGERDHRRLLLSSLDCRFVRVCMTRLRALASRSHAPRNDSVSVRLSTSPRARETPTASFFATMFEFQSRLAKGLSTRYSLDRELGQGGMAVVFLAHDLRHDRQVALKVLRPEISAEIGAERFLREIKLAAGLTHPHILPVFDSGEADGLLFYVMPSMEGRSLRERLDNERQLSLTDSLRIAREVASALDYAHRHNVVHRDIKPENILLHEGAAMVADFGIGKALSGNAASLTQTGLSLGTPAYMSPEQASVELGADGRSDLYSLG